MLNWKEYKVSDLLNRKVLIIGDGYRAKNIEFSATKVDGLPFARVGNINGGFDFLDADFFPIRNLKKVGEKISKVGDTVFTSKGTVGRFAFVDEKSFQFVYSPQLCFWRSLDFDFISPRFLFYWMQGREFFEQADAVKGQTDMADYVNLSDQRQMKITLPEIHYQLEIAESLSSLDEKIDLLHRQNKTLEQLAETLFRQWFVEEANESRGKGIINSLIEIQSGFAFKSDDFVEEGEYKLITIKNVQDGYLDLSRTNFLNEVPNRMPEYCLLEKGDILLSLTGNVGRCCLVTDENLFLNQRVAKLKARNNRDWAFTYIMFRQASMRRMLEELAKGTAQANLSPVETAQMEFQIPAEKLLQKYSDEATPILLKVLKNKKQIHTLTQLRDTILPKLMSGEVSVKNID